MLPILERSAVRCHGDRRWVVASSIEEVRAAEVTAYDRYTLTSAINNNNVVGREFFAIGSHFISRCHCRFSRRKIDAMRLAGSTGRRDAKSCRRAFGGVAKWP
jgi:imidazolonepropionase-like amidohydrolase